MARGGAELILGELRQLAGAEQHVVAHEVGHRDLGVAVLPGLQVEHEGGERPLEPGERAEQRDEARAGQLGGAGEIHAERGARARRAPWARSRTAAARPSACSSTLALSSAPSGTSSARTLGSPASSLLERRLARAQLLLVGLDLVLERRHLRHQRGGIAALPARPADLLRQRVAPRLALLQRGLQRPHAGILLAQRRRRRRQARGGRAPGRARPAPHAAISGRARQVTRTDGEQLRASDRNRFRGCGRVRCSAAASAAASAASASARLRSTIRTIRIEIS